MDPFMGYLLILAVGYWLRGGVARARGDFTRTRAEQTAAAEKAAKPGTVSPSMRRVLRRRHRAGWWASELRHGMPVTRTGMHAGWLAHQAAAEQVRGMRDEQGAGHLEARASFLEARDEYRRRQREAQERIDAALAASPEPVAPTRAAVREAAATVTPLFPRRGQVSAEPVPVRPAPGPYSQMDWPPVNPRPAARSGDPEPAPYGFTGAGHVPDVRDSSWLQPGQPRCEACGGTGGNEEGNDACPVCRGWGSADPDPSSLEITPPGTICAACGRPGTEDDPVLVMPGGSRAHRSHAALSWQRYTEALALERGRACTLCGGPLRLRDHDGTDHVDCNRVVSAEQAAEEVRDDRPLDEVERDLRAHERCPWQTGTDGGNTYCGAGITDTGGDDPDLFCLEHQCEYYGDEAGAAQERNERTLELLRQDAGPERAAGPGADFMPAPADDGPRCATVGHGDRPATHEITYTTPGARDDPQTDLVCAGCADGYSDRPALCATARRITPSTEGVSPMTADTNYTSVIAASSAAVARADQHTASIRAEAAAAYALADEMTALGVSARAISEQMNLADNLTAAAEKLDAAGECAGSTSTFVQQDHGGVEEAVANSPVAPAQLEFHGGN